MVGQDKEASVRILGQRLGHDLSRRQRLRCTTGQHTVNERLTCDDAVAGQPEPHTRQQATQATSAFPLRLRAFTQRHEPTRGEEQPVLQGRRTPVPLRHVGVFGKIEMPGQRQPHRRIGRLARQVAPVMQRQPGEEGNACAIGAQQFCDQFAGAQRPCVQPCGLRGCRGREPGQLGEGGQVTLGDQRGYARLIGDGPKQPTDPLRLDRRQQRGWGGGQRENLCVGQTGDDVVEEGAPHLKQMMALVEDQGDRASLMEPLHQRDAVGVQPRGALHGIGFCVEHGQRLIRQGGESGRQRPVGACWPTGDVFPRLTPLLDDGQVGAEHDDGSPPPQGRRDAHERLPGARGQDDPMTLILAGSDGVQRLALVTP